MAVPSHAMPCHHNIIKTNFTANGQACLAFAEQLSNSNVTLHKEKEHLFFASCNFFFFLIIF
jgi:hypothetical protein